MIRNRKRKQQSICKQPLECWIYDTPFNSYTRKFGFERDSASPATNLTARHCGSCTKNCKEYRKFVMTEDMQGLKIPAVANAFA